MNIDINQYDLNELFRFDLLKNILLNITTEQKKLSEEINEIKKSNKNRDDKINEKINSLEKFNSFKLLGLETDLNQNESDSNLNKENIGNANNDKTKINNIKDIDIENQNKESNNYTNYIQESSNKNTNNVSEGKKTVRRSVFNADNKNKMSKETLLFFMKETHSLEEKIINLENKLMNHFENQMKKIEDDSLECLNVSVTIGYTKFTRDKSLPDMVSEADKMLYEKKKETLKLKEGN